MAGDIHVGLLGSTLLWESLPEALPLHPGNLLLKAFFKVQIRNPQESRRGGGHEPSAHGIDTAKGEEENLLGSLHPIGLQEGSVQEMNGEVPPGVP